MARACLEPYLKPNYNEGDDIGGGSYLGHYSAYGQKRSSYNFEEGHKKSRLQGLVAEDECRHSPIHSHLSYHEYQG